MPEPTPQPTYDKRKLWKLALLVVPAIISGLSSYLKSRAEATDQAKASYEALADAVEHHDIDLKRNTEAVLVLRGEVTVLKEQLEAANRRTLAPGAQPLLAVRPPPARPPVRPSAAPDAGVVAVPSPVDPDGIADVERHPHKKPPSFDSVVQSYKSKK